MSMTGQFALYAVGLLYGVEFNRMVAEERALRKKQNSELRARIHKLEDAVRELNPGLNI